MENGDTQTVILQPEINKPPKWIKHVDVAQLQ